MSSDKELFNEVDKLFQEGDKLFMEADKMFAKLRKEGQSRIYKKFYGKGKVTRGEIVCLLMVLFIALAFALVAISNAKVTYVKDMRAVFLEFPNLIDIQKKLNELEPENPIEADGKYGTETRDKWERVWMNLQAKKYMEGTTK